MAGGCLRHREHKTAEFKLHFLCHKMFLSFLRTPEFHQSTNLGEKIFLLTSHDMDLSHHIISVMLPENRKGGNRKKYQLLIPHLLVSQTPCSQSPPSSPTSPAPCKVHPGKYNLSLPDTIIGGCYLPTFREPAIRNRTGG